MKKLLIAAIRFYRRTRPFHIRLLEKIFMTGPSCRFKPSCSQYALNAIEKYGAARGSYLALKRFLRCNPFFKGGYDPVT